MKNLHHHVASHHSFMYLWIIGAVLVLGGLVYSYVASHPAGVIDGAHEGDVRSTVAAFGNQLNAVSTLSPAAAEEIQNAYGPYVSEELLAAWIAHPEAAPGRATSSPWPDHIEIDTVTLNEIGAYEVAGRVMLMTSAGDAGSVPVALTVENTERGYRITAYEEFPRPAHELTTVSAALGETVSALSLTLTPEEVIEDSRCPMDAMCIQQGTARVRVLITSGMGTSTMTLTLDEPATTEAETILLTAVEPYPMASDPTEDEQYRFTFRVEQR
ncbi:MAG TPA: hypothetical protein VGE23_01850 [Candidatus Paceibacterota bacterium]